MGCDIHAHIEVRINGQWHHYSCPPIQRNYYLFEKICGVRGETKNAISSPRGLPKGLSVVTKICYNHQKPDAHSETWLSGVELDELIQWMDKRSDFLWQHKEVGYLTGNMFSCDHDGGHPKEITEARFICWFDN